VTRRIRIGLFILIGLYLALNFTSAYPIFGWHPSACLCGQCLEEFELDRIEGEQE
jgi:hypothetical protein